MRKLALPRLGVVRCNRARGDPAAAAAAALSASSSSSCHPPAEDDEPGVSTSNFWRWKMPGSLIVSSWRPKDLPSSSIVFSW